MVQVLLADVFSPELAQGLAAMGCQVVDRPELHQDELPGALSEAEILIVDRTRVTRRALERAPRLGLVVRTGAGTSTIDVAAASDHCVLVAHCPEVDASAQAELALGHLLALDQGLGCGRRGQGLAGSTLGLCGFDAAAALLAGLGRALGMRVVAWSERLTTALASEAGVSPARSPDELFAHSDVVSLHGPGGIGEPLATSGRIAQLAEGSVLVDVVDPSLLDAAACRARLEAQTLWLGVHFPGTDPADLAPLGGAGPRLSVTCGSSATAQTARTAAQQALAAVHAFRRAEPVPHAVNLLESTGSAVAELVLHHDNRAALLVAVLEVLRDQGIHAVDLSHVLFAGGRGALTRLRLSGVPAPNVVERVRASDGVRRLQLRER